LSNFEGWGDCLRDLSFDGWITLFCLLNFVLALTGTPHYIAQRAAEKSIFWAAL